MHYDICNNYNIYNGKCVCCDIFNDNHFSLAQRRSALQWPTNFTIWTLIIPYSESSNKGWTTYLGAIHPCKIKIKIHCFIVKETICHKRPDYIDICNCGIRISRWTIYKNTQRTFKTRKYIKIHILHRECKNDLWYFGRVSISFSKRRFMFGVVMYVPYKWIN